MFCISITVDECAECEVMVDVDAFEGIQLDRRKQSLPGIDRVHRRQADTQSLRCPHSTRVPGDGRLTLCPGRAP